MNSCLLSSLISIAFFAGILAKRFFVDGTRLSCLRPIQGMRLSGAELRLATIDLSVDRSKAVLRERSLLIGLDDLRTFTLFLPLLNYIELLG